jgi:hypothetical protein
MKCLRCNLVNPRSTGVCKRCQNPLQSGGASPDAQINIYRDADFLIIKTPAALPRRCYRCNAREIEAVKPWAVEYVPAAEQALETIVGQLLPVPLPLDLSPGRKVLQMNLAFCRRHRISRWKLNKYGLGVVIFGALCFAAAFAGDRQPDFFVYAMIASVAAFCLGFLILYADHEKEVVSKHKYSAPYFWVEGFGDEYLSSFPDWTNSPDFIKTGGRDG